MSSPAERPTPGEYREMADWISQPAYTTFDNAQRFSEIAHAIRCAAEDAERAQEMRALLRVLVKSERLEVQYHDRAVAILGTEGGGA